MGENIANIILDKGLVSKMDLKKLIKMNTKKTNNQLKNGHKAGIATF